MEATKLTDLKGTETDNIGPKDNDIILNPSQITRIKLKGKLNKLYKKLDIGDFECLSCFKLYKNESYMKRHVKSHNSEEHIIENRDKISFKRDKKKYYKEIEKDKFKCCFKTCTKEFKSEKYMKKHILSHVNKKKIACHFAGCNKKVSTIKNLKVSLSLIFIIVLDLYSFFFIFNLPLIKSTFQNNLIFLINTINKFYFLFIINRYISDYILEKDLLNVHTAEKDLWILET